MQRVYIARDPLDGNMLKSFLESHGIKAHVQDERTHSLHGEVPFVYPSVWVRDEDLEEARKLVERYETEQGKPPEDEAEWTCPTCGEKHSSKYTECWKCTPQEEA